jgi:hypothetical protein
MVFGSVLALCCPVLIGRANAAPQGSDSTPVRSAQITASWNVPARYAGWKSVVMTPSATGRYVATSRYVYGRPLQTTQIRQAMRNGGISCVPYARNVSGIQVVGNAWEWWHNASGTYARGPVPEVGSVLAFRANGRMRLGHVAVVSRVINARVIEINHANWASTGVVARGVTVVDVSEANNWTAVRVGLAGSEDFGSVYPTYGFIYARPDNGAVVAATEGAVVPPPAMNPAPSDLRPVAERPWRTYSEVAEAPPGPARPDPTPSVEPAVVRATAEVPAGGQDLK